MRRAAVILTLALAGCATGRVPDPPETVEVIVERIVPVPARLTEACDTVPKRSNTVGEAVRLANARLASLNECNKRMAEIRGLKPEDVKP